MNLTTQTIILATVMAALSALIQVFPALKKHSKICFLMGTGAMLGICCFDLIPDVFTLGGSSTLYIIFGVYVLYSVAHVFHLGHHHAHGPHATTDAHDQPLIPFLTSMIAHCFSSGMLLSVSRDFSERLSGTVFMALLAHKTYESILVSTVLLESSRSRVYRSLAIILYSIALPLGVIAASVFSAELSRTAAMIISSIAVGTLIGCLIHDFLVPSIRHLRQRKHEAVYLAIGLIITQIMMRFA